MLFSIYMALFCEEKLVGQNAMLSSWNILTQSTVATKEKQAGDFKIHDAFFPQHITQLQIYGQWRNVL